ncbi:uncharacterized protein SPPG_00117 [Spizellomyces punctatus DAOM BR117]|uniref:Galactose oxidase n=1 Tax=Spizellomyces punctatus (strain DAOM BR117) TaxID=645134 RepID=A0A0L0HSP3_SPIPD|nr:uncharacterized protein SPPG_00117 [Spizellomyces punctatus DAOM BR117]KND04386.1 hypothetical protein SPPG_00117 [Spizellomyces punctatus DAOM BR117]|eukprot:XP_016612425.1 hypothetical protein SPPG_00117 [Spizellomyces punctatus DAOM BR117]
MTIYSAAPGNVTPLKSPIPSMHWSRVPMRGTHIPPPLRAHTTTALHSKLYVFGGCDAKSCFNQLWVFDTESLWWTRPVVRGSVPRTVRAHAACVIADRYIVYFGGGDGPVYYDGVYVLDTVEMAWHTPRVSGVAPSARRAHTMWVWEGDVYVYAGGDGVRALNDVFVLRMGKSGFGDSKRGDPRGLNDAGPDARHGETLEDSLVVEWQVVETRGPVPSHRGYHTSTRIGHTPHVLVYGGSDGHECFSDVSLLDMQTLTWKSISLDRAFPRLSHTATQVGSYLFVLGGHDGTRYGNEALLLNLVTMNWETRNVCGSGPEGRGYHSACLVDSRVWVFGGYDGTRVYGDMWVLELSASAYLPQITAFEVGCGDDVL